MTASDQNKESLEALGRGDGVTAIESAKRAALDLVESIDADPQEASVERVVERTSRPGEDTLATLYPLIEYGDARAIEVIPRVLLHVASSTSAVLQETSAQRLGGTVALGRMVWATTAYAIHCGRFDALAEASRATVRVPFSRDETVPLIALSKLRYVDALNGSASESFDDYRSWLRSLPLIDERYPLFASELEWVFPEADLLLALILTRQRGRVYSVGHDSNTVPRLARRLRDRKHRTALAVLFGSSAASLDGALEAAYNALETDQRRWESPPATLFGAEE